MLRLDPARVVDGEAHLRGRLARRQRVDGTEDEHVPRGAGGPVGDECLTASVHGEPDRGGVAVEKAGGERLRSDDSRESDGGD